MELTLFRASIKKNCIKQIKNYRVKSMLIKQYNKFFTMK